MIWAMHSISAKIIGKAIRFLRLLLDHDLRVKFSHLSINGSSSTVLKILIEGRLSRMRFNVYLMH